MFHPRLQRISGNDLVSELRSVGGLALPGLQEDARKELLAEALKHEFLQGPPTYGKGNVVQELSSCEHLPEGGLLWQFARSFEELLEEKFRHMETYPFAQAFSVTEVMLQRYPKGASVGVGPHRDQSSRINLVCVFVLCGSATFALCDDKEGNGQMPLPNLPGTLSILRGPGFLGQTDGRRYHMVRDVTEDRIILALRQIRKK